MHVFRWWVAGCALLCWPSVHAEEASRSAANALTLQECYQLALARSEELAIKQELLRETEGRFLQALSGALPSVSFESSKKWQDGTGTSAFTLKEVPERKFVFSQPLFSGFKEFSAIAGVRAERRQRELERRRAEQLLLIDVAEAFYLLRQQREDLQALEATRLALTDRIDELKSRERLGRSRLSEVVSAEAQLRRLEAELEVVRSRETTSRQLLEFLTGLPRIEAVADEDLAPLAVNSEEEVIGHASRRPDVLAAEEAWKVNRHEVTIARSDLWPEIDVEGNYYTRRIGNASGVDWDVLLKLDVPIFEGGEAFGAVKAAASKTRQAHLQFERRKREAELEIRQAYATWHANRLRQAALEQSLKAAEENYRLQVEEYRLSLVGNLDVLQTLQALQDIRREAIAATYDMKRSRWSLRVAMGEAPQTSDQ